jgi:phospholipase/lecithinase/hemolysin
MAIGALRVRSRVEDVEMSCLKAVLIALAASGTATAGYLHCSSIGLADPSASLSVIHLGIMGDSASDEYRADDNRGGVYGSTTLTWDEQLQRYRGIDIGGWGKWGGTRRSGYEYNWALSGATAQDVVNTGQAAGVAGQVAAGKIDTVVLYVGANDFAIWNGTYGKIYDGALTDQTVKDYISRIVSGIVIAIDMVRAAGAVNMIVTNLQDRGAGPRFTSQFPDATKRQRVTDALVAVNAGVESAVNARRDVALIDLYNATKTPEIRSRTNLARGTFLMAGQEISLIVNGDEPHHAVLADNEHNGTVVQCLIANYIFVSPLNSKFGQHIRPFTDEECLTNAGISVDVR